MTHLIADPSGLLVFLIVIIVFLTIMGIFTRIILGSRSKRYREMMTDLYVVGKIRLLSKKDGIDLKEELKDLVKSIKEHRRYTQSLDRTIEEELQEKIVNEGKETDSNSN